MVSTENFTNTENLAKLPQLYEVCLKEFGHKTFSHNNYKFKNKSCDSYSFLIIKPEHYTFDADSIIKVIKNLKKCTNT